MTPDELNQAWTIFRGNVEPWLDATMGPWLDQLQQDGKPPPQVRWRVTSTAYAGYLDAPADNHPRTSCS